MKTKLKNAVVLGCLMLASVAQAQDVIQTTSEINAQATITRGNIDNVLERMAESRPSSQFRATDYHAQNSDFQSKLEAALVKFEDTLTKDIFAKAAFWMDQYNSVYASSEFTPEQKAILLAQRMENLKNQFKTLSTEYQAAINKVYGLVPNFDLALNYSKTTSKRICAETDSDSVSVFYSSAGKTVGGKAKIALNAYDHDDNDYLDIILDGKMFQQRLYNGQTRSWVSFDSQIICKKRYTTVIDFSKMIETYPNLLSGLNSQLYPKVYPAIKGKCRSSICLGLRSGDLVNLLTQVKTKIDRNISMKLASGQQVVLVGSNADLKLIQSLLVRTDYPETLPFDL